MAEDKKKNSVLKFEDFWLRQMTFELRHVSPEESRNNKSYLIEKIERQLPFELNLLDQDNDGLAFTYNKKFEFRFLPGKFAVINFYPEKSIKEFIEISTIFTETAKEDLEIDQITRVGLRLIFIRDCKDGIEVAELLYKTPHFKVPDNLLLKDSIRPLIPSFSVGWQSEEKGTTYRLKGESGKLKFDFPLLLSASGEYPDKIEKEFNHVILDIDLYIHKPILPGQFFAGDWIKGAFETVKKEGSKFFGDKDD